MKSYRIKTVEDIYNLPSEHYEEFIGDLNESLKLYSKKRIPFTLITSGDFIFKPDGLKNNVVSIKE